MGLFALADRAVRFHTAHMPARPGFVPAGDATSEESAPPGQEGSATSPPGSVTEALKTLVDFIPTESVVLFWLAVPAAKSLAAWMAERSGQKPPASPNGIDWLMFGALSLLTPALLLLSYLSQLARQGQARPPVRLWPWWKATAATVAFMSWAFAVPGNPFVSEPALLMSIWVGATLVSVVLSLLDPIVMSRSQSSP